MKWEKKSEFNETIGGEDFYVSYNGQCGGAYSKAWTGGGTPETALVILEEGKKPNFMILDGDFRKEYEEAYPKGKKACIKVFNDNIEHQSSWSTNSTDMPPIF